MKTDTSLFYGFDDAPPKGQSLILALQHVLVLIAGVEFIPLVLAKSHGLGAQEIHRAAFATAAAASLGAFMQLCRYKRFGLGNLMFIGASSAFLSCSHAALQMGGAPLVAAMGLCCAPILFLYSFFFRRLRNVVTPVVGGVVIMLAMTGLLKDAVAIWTGTNNTPESALKKLLVGVVTVAVLLLAEWYGGKKTRPWCLALGVAAGSLAAWPLGLLSAHGDLGRVPLFGLPQSPLPTFAFSPTTEHFVLLFTFAVAALVTGVKYTGDAMALQRISRPGVRKLDYDALQGGLYANAAGSALSALFGGLPTASHSPNVSLVQATGAASRRVGLIGAGLLMVFAFCPRVIYLMYSIPGSVLGATAVILVAQLFATGMRLAASEGLNQQNSLIVGLSLCAGLISLDGRFFSGILPASFSPLTSNGFAVGGLTAVLLTLVSRNLPGKKNSLTLQSSDNLSVLAGWLSAMAAKFKLNDKNAFRLELCCEEVWMHMRSRLEKDGQTGPITCGIRSEHSRLAVELGCGAGISDLDALSPATENASKEDLDRLGLLLLSKMADNVRHIHIAGHTYVSFTLDVD